MQELDVEAYKAAVFGEGQSHTHSPNPTPEAAATPAIENPTEQLPAPEAIPSPEAVTNPEPTLVDDNVYLKEHFGYDSREVLKADLETLRELKEKASTPAEIKFANDESKKIYNLLAEGKTKEVKSYLEAQELLSNVDGMNEEQQLKLYIKMQNTKFDKELIEDEYDSVYKINEDDDKYIDNPLLLRKDRARLEQRLENDLLKAKEYFSAYKSKIELPDISPKPEPAKDDAYEAWKSQVDQQASIAQQTAEAYKKLTPKQAASTFKFNDEASKLAFDTAFEPDAESFTKVVDLISDTTGEKIFSHYANQDGSLDHARFARDFYNGQNIDKIVTEQVKQAVNATKAWFLKNQKNIGDGSQRLYAAPVVTDVQKLREQVFG